MPHDVSGRAVARSVRELLARHGWTYLWIGLSYQACLVLVAVVVWGVGRDARTNGATMSSPGIVSLMLIELLLWALASTAQRVASIRLAIADVVPAMPAFRALPIARLAALGLASLLGVVIAATVARIVLIVAGVRILRGMTYAWIAGGLLWWLARSWTGLATALVIASPPHRAWAGMRQSATLLRGRRLLALGIRTPCVVLAGVVAIVIAMYEGSETPASLAIFVWGVSAVGTLDALLEAAWAHCALRPLDARAIHDVARTFN